MEINPLSIRRSRFTNSPDSVMMTFSGERLCAIMTDGYNEAKSNAIIGAK